MLLVYTPKITPRITYIFKHICTRIIGLQVDFTSKIENFVAHNGPKLSYGKQALGNEFFIKSSELLFQQGLADIEINVKPWEETKCFFSTSDTSGLPFDIFAASFFMLSRYEEYQPHVKDVFGRFSSSESLAFKEGFLNQPVVNIWAQKFLTELKLRFPDIDRISSSFTTHNLILVSEAYKYKNKGLLRSVFGFFNDFFRFRFRSVFKRIKVVVFLKKDPYNTFDLIINACKNNKTKLTVFFKLGNFSQLDLNISHLKNSHRSLIKSVADYAQVGLQISNGALKDFIQLKKEKKRLEEIIHRPLLETFNSHCILQLPEILHDLVDIEVANNYTMGYCDTIGFRAGTCTPFFFYDLDFEIQTPLKIHSFSICKDGLSEFENDVILQKVSEIKDEIKKVNGTLLTVFNNEDFSVLEKNNIWRMLLKNNF